MKYIIAFFAGAALQWPLSGEDVPIPPPDVGALYGAEVVCIASFYTHHTFGIDKRQVCKTASEWMQMFKPSA